ncbi:MAG: alpha/beta hydrolase [Rhodobacteraceae bacterium]|nr:alpha/beta hydrolase [Paracoccaceae bacterium]
MRQHTIEGTGGVTLHVRDAGPEDAPTLLLIHGWSQHHLSWSKQLRGPLARRFRLIAPDLRGHGASDKPADPAAYDNSAPWAGDIAAIIRGLSLSRPVLVGWSMGGWVVCDYLRLHGGAEVAGVALVGSTIRMGQGARPGLHEKRRPEVRADGMYSEDQPTNLAATIAFVKACVAAPLSKIDLALMVGFNMLVPPHVRAAARLRSEDYAPVLAAYQGPAALFYGEAEKIILPAMQREAEEALPHARRFRYAGVGHAPFWEAPARFDADLAAFAEAALSEEATP